MVLAGVVQGNLGRCLAVKTSSACCSSTDSARVAEVPSTAHWHVCVWGGYMCVGSGVRGGIAATRLHPVVLNMRRMACCYDTPVRVKQCEASHRRLGQFLEGHRAWRNSDTTSAAGEISSTAVHERSRLNRCPDLHVMHRQRDVVCAVPMAMATSTFFCLRKDKWNLGQETHTG